MKQFIVLLLGVLLMAGCSQKPKQTADVNILFNKVNASLMAGETNTAITVLSKALEDKTYNSFRGQIFSHMLGIMLMGNQVDEVKARHLAVIGKDEELTRIGFSVLGNYYARSPYRNDFDAWTTTMMGQALPKDLLEQAFLWQIGICQSRGASNRIVALIPVVNQKFNIEARRRILQNMVSIQIGDQKYDQAHTMIDAVGMKTGDDVEMKYFLDVQRTQVFFLQGRWQDGEKKFQEIAAELPDAQLAACFHQIVTRCNQKEQFDLVDKLCEFILDNQKNKGGTIQEAASQWLTLAKTHRNIADIPGRIEALKTKGISPELLFHFVQNYFYIVVQDGTKEQVAAMSNFAEKLMSDIHDEESQNQLKTLVLDGAFIQEDYDRVIKLLESGIKGREKSWMNLALNKARAHQMLKAGNTTEAVNYFRKFMEGVAKWDKPEQDPCTGIIYSKEMCLGYNAKRIGDILGKAGETKASEDAYSEAKVYYDKALANLKNDTREMEFINKELAAIPAKKN